MEIVSTKMFKSKNRAQIMPIRLVINQEKIGVFDFFVKYVKHLGNSPSSAIE